MALFTNPTIEIIHYILSHLAVKELSTLYAPILGSLYPL